MAYRKLTFTDKWPAYNTWEKLPKGYKWITLCEAPCSYVNIRDRGNGDTFELYLGKPFPMADSEAFDVSLGAHSGETFVRTAASHGGGTVTIKSNQIVFILSDCENPFLCPGNLRLQVGVSGNTSTVAALSFIVLATKGLSAASVRARSTGPDNLGFVTAMFDEIQIAGEPEAYPQPTSTIAPNAGVVHGFSRTTTPIYATTTYAHYGIPDSMLIYYNTTYTGGVRFRLSVMGGM